MSDGDHIVLKKNCDQGVEDGKVRFGLVCSGTWWKAITLHQGQGHYLSELVAVQDEPGITKVKLAFHLLTNLNIIDTRNCWQYADVDHSSLELYDYVLSKAKTFGVHTDMYRISNVQDAKAGCAYTFEWLRD